MKRKLIIGSLILLTIGFFLGPKPRAPQINFKNQASSLPTSLSEIESYITLKEKSLDIKKGNSSLITWANDSVSKTEYSLVYLHGFSASPEEGAPVHRQIAESYGMNFYAPRLAHHGLNGSQALINFSTKEFIEDAYQAIKVGELLGEKVIVMSCSTGGTASLYCSAHSDINIHAQILYSPNIAMYDSKSWFLSVPWGLQLARIVKGGNYHSSEVPEGAEQYWYGKYRLESLVDLQCGLENLMTHETFNKVHQKTMVSYYYKNENQQDDVVSIKSTKKMISNLGISEDNLHEVAFTEVGAHALQSKFFSKDIPSVLSETENYLENILGIKKPL